MVCFIESAFQSVNPCRGRSRSKEKFNVGELRCRISMEIQISLYGECVIMFNNSSAENLKMKRNKKLIDLFKDVVQIFQLRL